MHGSVQSSPARRRLLLASDRSDRSSELVQILSNVADVDMIPSAALPDTPPRQISGIVVDINLRSAESVQAIRRKLSHDSYQPVPRLFVLADVMHHNAMQAWALGATDTIARPFSPFDILQRVEAAFPDADEAAAIEERGAALNKGVAAAHAVMVKIFDKLPAGIPLTINDVMRAEGSILRAIKRSSLRDWLAAVGRHHNASYRHSLIATGFAVAFAQHLGLRDADQRRLTRAALLHDVGTAFIPVEILDNLARLTDEEAEEYRRHPRLGYQALAAQGSFPREMLDVVLHHHELLDGSGYPDGLRGDQISDIVHVTTLVATYATLIDPQALGRALSRTEAFAAMEAMGDRLDQRLVQTFRPVALGS
jgi:HD-GYP domain-containing protein (c-di-GMP phosphodiesterase class II)